MTQLSQQPTKYLQNLLSSETKHTTTYWTGNPANVCANCSYCSVNKKHPAHLVCSFHERRVDTINKCLNYVAKKRK